MKPIYRDDYDKDFIYKEKRVNLSNKYGSRELFSVIDQWPLYCGQTNLNRYISIYELLKLTENVPGHIAEFGCWRGANLMFLSKILNILDPHSMKLVFGFESFEGLTEFDEKDFDAKTKEGSFKGSYNELIDFIDLYDFNSKIVIKKGIIEDTLPKLLNDDKSLSFSFVYIDTDLYSSTKLILENIHDRLMVGGIIVFDEWNFEEYPGETIAIREFLKDFNDSYEVCTVKNTRQPSMYMKKIKQ